MTPEDAWVGTMQQLRGSLSRNAFDTWVLNATLVGYQDQDKQFLIGTTNQYGCDWLNQNLIATASRILSGFMGEPVTVAFIVKEQVTRQVVEFQGLTNLENEVEQDNNFVDDAQEETIELIDSPRSLYNAIVQPERILSLPRYLLRFLPLVGSEIFLVQWAFRQMRFLKTETGKRHLSYEARIDDLLDWATWTSRASFRRYMDRPALKWFGIEQIPQEGRAFDPITGLAKQKPNRYRIQIDISLTPMDADSLKTILVVLGIQEDPIKALKKALELPVDKLRPERPFPLPTPEHLTMQPKVILVDDLVRELMGTKIKLDPEARKEIKELSERLADKITRPNESIQVTWYFFKNWLAEFDRADLGMFVILMRSLCYYNPDEKRDTVWIDGGYGEISSMLGINREKTIISWFPRAYTTGPQRKDTNLLADHSRKEKERSNRDESLIQNFLKRIGKEPNKSGSHTFGFMVRVGNDPLIPNDKILYDILVKIYSFFEATQSIDFLAQWITKSENSAFETLGSSEIPLLRLSEPSDIPLLRLSESLNSAFETLKSSKIPLLRLSNNENSAFETLDTLLNSAFETLGPSKSPLLRLILKYLKESVPLREVPKKTTTTDTKENLEIAENDPMVVEDLEKEEFNLKDLLNQNVKSNNFQNLLYQSEQGISWPFVSWLLYINSPDGQSLTKNPIGIIVKNLQANPGKGAGGAYDRLARRGKDSITKWLTQSLCSITKPDEADWRQVFGEAKEDRLRRLADQLDIPIPETSWY